MEGTVFDIQRNSLNDGPGIRTTVFLKGCALNCLWCHNRESIAVKPLLRFYPDKCQNCMECVTVCDAEAHLDLEGKHAVDFARCVQNWDCIQVCPSGALVKTGKNMSIEEVMQIFLKDRDYFDRSGGGITLSGGEPMIQYEFSKSLLAECHVQGIHTCLDTTGYTPWERLKSMMACTDLFLYDYKETDPKKHKEFTGVDNILIRENLARLNDAGAAIVLRCPVIPGMNDNEEHLGEIARLSRMYEGIREVHILPYHTLGIGKAEQHGIKAEHVTFSIPDEKIKAHWWTILNSHDAKNFRIF